MAYVKKMVAYYCPNCTFKKVMNYLIKIFSAPGMLSKLTGSLGSGGGGLGPMPSAPQQPIPMSPSIFSGGPMPPDFMKLLLDRMGQGVMPGQYQDSSDVMKPSVPYCIYCNKEAKDCQCPKDAHQSTAG